MDIACVWVYVEAAVATHYAHEGPNYGIYDQYVTITIMLPDICYIPYYN